jgi:drug/metabolite transporter (DMT)-like permease
MRGCRAITLSFAQANNDEHLMASSAAMGVILALLSAVLYGCADFGGGRATRLAKATTVTITSQLAGFVAVLAIAPFFPHGPISARMLIAGGLGGIAGGVGIMLLYQALAVGTMSIVSPVTAVCAALVPLLGGLLLGERPGVLALIGLICALAAIVLVSLVKGDHAPHAGSTILMAIGAGLAFGLFYLALAKSGPHPGMIPLVTARVASVGLACVVAMRRSEPFVVARAALPMVAGVGAIDMSANALFLLASHRGLLAVTGVIASLYPTSTVLLARWLDRERLRPVQWLGLGFATLALVLISGATS